VFRCVGRRGSVRALCDVREASPRAASSMTLCVWETVTCSHISPCFVAEVALLLRACHAFAVTRRQGGDGCRCQGSLLTRSLGMFCARFC
jgi:hypothetical protein